MRKNISQLAINITGSNRGLASSLKDSRERVNRFNRDTDKLRGSFGDVRTAVLGIGTALAGLQAGRFIGDFVSDSIRLAAEAETVETQFKVMLGSIENARDLLGEIEGFSLATPFRLPELQNASRQLLAYGITAQDILPTLKTLGDIAAGTGSQLSDVSEIYGRVAVSNRLAGEEINRLQDRAIPILKLLADQLNVSVSEARKLSSEGRIGFAELQRAFADLTSEGGLFNDQMVELSQTTAGLFSSLQDEIDATKREIGEGLLPVSKDLLSIFRELAANGQELDLKENIEESASLVSLLANGTAGLAQGLRTIPVGIGFAASEITAALADITIDPLLGTDLAGDAQALADELANTGSRLAESSAILFGIIEDTARIPVPTAKIEGLESVIDQAVEGQEELTTSVDRTADAYERMVNAATSSAERLAERYRTPVQQFRAAVDEINEAVQLGGLSNQAAARGLQSEFQRLIDIAQRAREALQFSPALERGSQEEIRARNQRFIGGISDQRIEQLRETAKRLIEFSREQTARTIQQITPPSIQASNVEALRGSESSRQTAANTARIAELIALEKANGSSLQRIQDAIRRSAPVVVNELSA